MDKLPSTETNWWLPCAGPKIGGVNFSIVIDMMIVGNLVPAPSTDASNFMDQKPKIHQQEEMP